ncbi:MAG: PD40 domain-containing protein [Sporocytophaga sp.]|uniref:hypothetical protein n=1 Tax=Sporocytophaga sp. TaxID=2231183 RepID=UPI001B25CE1A|nr:hypothetical protein [Sporocytophaga sp.]MBO9703767.1 PD40 domain-containing protein [Sporocytophaga sp.]
MKRLSFLLFFIICFNTTKHAYCQGTSLSQPINSPLGEELNPSVSADGKTLLFLSNYGEEKSYPVVSYLKSGVWTRPDEVTALNTPSTKLNNNLGYNLSPMGNEIFFSSNRYGGIGSNDLWMVEKTPTGWSTPKNPGKPLNSAQGEADPSLSPDGKQLYFVKWTDKKSSAGLPCGKITVSQRTSKEGFREPVDLPAPVNSGCECSPRILSDGKTLIFSSERAGGKGGFDFYRTQRKDDGSWTTPIPLTYINTKADEVYAAIPANAEMIYYTAVNGKSKDIYRSKLSPEFQPDRVFLLAGKIKEETGKTVAGKIIVTELPSKKLISVINLKQDEPYLIILPKGKTFDVTAYGSTKGWFYNGNQIPLDTLTKSVYKEQDFKLPAVKLNTAIDLSHIQFEGSSLSPSSSMDLDKLVKWLQENPTAAIEIGTSIPEVKSDTIQTPELTEVKEETVTLDTTQYIRKIYHNDVTQKHADAIASYLTQKGAASTRIKPVGYGDKKKSNDSGNKVEITILKE